MNDKIYQTADFTNHLEDYEKMVAANVFNIYECTNCYCSFAVSQAFDDHSVIACPSCLSDEAVEDMGSSTMMKGE